MNIVYTFGKILLGFLGPITLMATIFTFMERGILYWTYRKKIKKEFNDFYKLVEEYGLIKNVLKHSTTTYRHSGHRDSFDVLGNILAVFAVINIVLYFVLWGLVSFKAGLLSIFIVQSIVSIACSLYPSTLKLSIRDKISMVLFEEVKDRTKNRDFEVRLYSQFFKLKEDIYNIFSIDVAKNDTALINLAKLLILLDDTIVIKNFSSRNPIVEIKKLTNYQKELVDKFYNNFKIEIDKILERKKSKREKENELKKHLEKEERRKRRNEKEKEEREKEKLAKEKFSKLEEL